MIGQTSIITVLRSGGEYHDGHVERLRKQCEKHAPGVPFLCLSDAGEPLLLHDWPGWWSKIELFRLTGPFLYMDLDTTICGDISPLLMAARHHDFIALRDFNPKERDIGSGLMAWRGDLRRLYDEFAKDPAGHMAACRSRRWWGDQGFIDRHVGSREYWQTLVPGAVVSWKKHCRNGVPSGASVVCFHGKPRPWDVKEMAA